RRSNMNRPWAALGLVLALCTIMPREASAQGSQKNGNKPSMRQNYPNPFNPATYQPFSVAGPTCTAEPNRTHRITVKVINVLGQVVAYPVLNGTSGGVAGGTPLKGVLLPCGDHVALWDEKRFGSGREPASGIYIFLVDQDGVQVSSKAIVSK
ncbi:MAG: hypothetical protein ABI852_19515, partial [Gemmatimonadaceae bacterium]